MNISSAIVYAKDTESVIEKIDEIVGCEVHLCDEERGIIIISIEAENVEEEMKIFEKVGEIEGVIEADMHYSYSEDELQKAKENISREVPSILDDSISIDEVRYSGSVYNQMNKDH